MTYHRTVSNSIVAAPAMTLRLDGFYEQPRA
jgi:hypothetical protein